MPEPGKAFAVASDDTIVVLIRRAVDRLVVIAPALSLPVAEALAARFADLGRLGLTVILDADPDVYRLGFGDEAALKCIQQASVDAHFDLRQQPGIRVGVVISDDTTLIYAPVSKNVEAEPVSDDRPNAIVLSGAAADRLVRAAGAATDGDASMPEIGEQALLPSAVEAMRKDLEVNPPRKFDIARRMNVFSSAVQYVDLEVSNYRLTTRKIALPPALVGVQNTDLKKLITGRIAAPTEGLGPILVTIPNGDATEALLVDDKSLSAERKRIEDTYTFPIAKFGRVILFKDKDAFVNAVTRFQAIIDAYQKALKATLGAKRSAFEGQILAEFLPRWKASPPEHLARFVPEYGQAFLEEKLKELAKTMFDEAVNFDAPTVKHVFKNVAPENLESGDFLKQLRDIMLKRQIPRAIIDRLFETGTAAPESGVFV